MKIEQRVFRAVDYALAGDIAAALSDICPAIDATARKKYQEKGSRTLYKKFLREHYDIIEPFIGQGINLAETAFPINLETTDGKLIDKPDFADVIYHAHRCALAHGEEINERFCFTQSERQGEAKWTINLEEGRLHMPDKVIWALIAVTVFCEANAEISTCEAKWLTWGSEKMRSGQPYRFDIDLFWGAEGTVRAFFEKRQDPKVTWLFQSKED